MPKLISVFNPLGGEVVPQLPFPQTLRVIAGTTSSIQPGMLVVTDGSNAGYVAAAPDDTDSTFEVWGVCSEASTETASADGTVNVLAAPVLLVNIFAETPGSLVQTMKVTNRYVLGVSGGDYTLDQSTTTNGIFKLINYDNTTSGLCVASVRCNAY